MERAPQQADASVVFSQAAKEVASYELSILADGEGFVKPAGPDDVFGLTRSAKQGSTAAYCFLYVTLKK
jgi:diaminopimelate epimerase